MQLAYSQKTLTGLVSDNDGLPLPGATVLVSGTLTGVTTDFDGNFSINASEGQQLEFSFVGYETATVTVGSSNVINITLSPGNQLDEVIVTSLGITREKRALGYAVSRFPIFSRPSTNALIGNVTGRNGNLQG